MEDKSIFELIAEYSAGTISPVDAELLRERLESDADAMRLFREIREGEKILKSVQVQEKLTFRSRGYVLIVLWLGDLEKDGGCSGEWVPWLLLLWRYC